MLLGNPTPYPILAQAGGEFYNFEPGEEKDVWDRDHAKLLLENFKHRGLVHFTFAKELQVKYKNFENFKKEKSLEGLKELLKWKKDCLNFERQAIREVREKNGAEADRSLMSETPFQDSIKEIESLISSFNKSEDLTETRRGRPRKSVEPSHDSNQSAQ